MIFFLQEENTPDWADAACLGVTLHGGPDFFPPDNPGGPKSGRGVLGEATRIRAAKALCAVCPLVSECLDYAVRTESMGIWGGTTDSERARMTSWAV